MVVMSLTLLLANCGVRKKYVANEIAKSEERLTSRIQDISNRTELNSAEIANLENLALELSRKTDLAINKAAGFEDYQVIWEGNVLFGFDKAALDGEAKDVLSVAGDTMMILKRSIIEIAGHTDPIGPADYNYQLGQRRANATHRFLSEKFGIPLYRMFIVSYGKDKPIAMPDMRNSNARNRRVTLRIWAPPLL